MSEDGADAGLALRLLRKVLGFISLLWYLVNRLYLEGVERFESPRYTDAQPRIVCRVNNH